MKIPEIFTSNPNEFNQPPIEQASTIPSSWYHDQEVYDFEQDVLFARNWQYVCHQDQLKNVGDVVHATIAGNPILVIKTKDEGIRAFYNVCKHRGGPLAVKKGTTTVLQCQYHGWTYLTDGSLRGVPDWNLVELFDEKNFGLEPVELSFWDGLIFARIESGGPDLLQIVEGISDRISPISMEKLQFYKEIVYDINCNWKVYVDNYLEGYHIPIVHPELANLLDYKNYVTEAYPWYSLQYSPFRGEDNVYQTEEGEAFYYFLFPNMMLNILPGRLQVNLVEPVSTNRCKVYFWYFYDDLSAKESTGIIKDDLEYSEVIQQEDIEICEAVQRGLQSKAYDKGRFSVKRELGVYHFQSLLKKQFRSVL
ncbi:MAG: Rieske 2Fe-2S domain-containing protein [bacterium]|nr:Rieske 2Fe-2S domain-containing protein [bacterium]